MPVLDVTWRAQMADLPLGLDPHHSDGVEDVKPPATDAAMSGEQCAFGRLERSGVKGTFNLQ